MALLSAFAVAARAGSVQQAARQLGLNRNSLTRYLDELEQAAGGAPLRERSGETRGMVLTPAGRHLLSLLTPVVDRLATVAEQIQGGLPELRLGCQSSTSTFLLPGWLRAFEMSRGTTLPAPSRHGTGSVEAQPLSMTLRTGSSESLLEALRGLVIDVALIASEAARPVTDGGIQVAPLFQEMLVGLCHRAHPLAGEPAPVPAARLLADPRYLYYVGGAQYQRHLNGLAGPEGIVRATELDSIFAIKEMVRAGVGVSIIPRSAMRPEDREWAVVLPLEAPPEKARWLRRSLVVATRSGAPLTPLAEEFVCFLLSRRGELARPAEG